MPRSAISGYWQSFGSGQKMLYTPGSKHSLALLAGKTPSAPYGKDPPVMQFPVFVPDEVPVRHRPAWSVQARSVLHGLKLSRVAMRATKYPAVSIAAPATN